MGRRPQFSGLPAEDRRAAARLLHSYNTQIAAYQREFENRATAPGVGLYHLRGLQLSEYLGFTKLELSMFTDLQHVRGAIEARRAQIKRKIAEQRQQARSAATGHGLGLIAAEYLAMAVCYNHGEGARYYGYVDAFAEMEPTDIEEWY